MMAARKWSGEHYSDQSFHLHYRKKFLGCDDVRLPTGEIMSIPVSTANMPVDEFADYFDKVQADAAERGVYLADMESA